jgi:hypothetical protein
VAQQEAHGVELAAIGGPVQRVEAGAAAGGGIDAVGEQVLGDVAAPEKQAALSASASASGWPAKRPTRTHARICD